jgi:hypothetical protein
MEPFHRFLNNKAFIMVMPGPHLYIFSPLNNFSPLTLNLNDCLDMLGPHLFKPLPG